MCASSATSYVGVASGSWSRTARSAKATPVRILLTALDSTLAFYADLTINANWSRTRSARLSREDTSYRAQLDYAGDRYGVQLERLYVGPHFNPEIGFVRRRDIRRTFGLFRFSPRPSRSKLVRKYSWAGSIAYVETTAGRVESRDRDAEFSVEFHNSDRFSVAYSNSYEFLPVPFPIATGVTLPVGGYSYGNFRTGYNFGQHRRLSGNLMVEYGTFFSGHKTTLSLSRSRVNLTSQLSMEPTYSIDRVELVEEAFTTHLAGSRVTYTVTPLMFVSALLQYNSSGHLLEANVRLRWKYHPGSELFVVYNDARNTMARGFPALANRAVILKINRLLRF